MSVVSKVLVSLIKRNHTHRLVSVFKPNYEKSQYLNCHKYFHTNNRLEALVSFNLSDIGEGIREVVVKEWFVKVGDKVSQFDNICEVQSDKASVTITSRYDGVITKLHYPVEQIALVGKPLVDIETVEEADESSQPAETKNDIETTKKSTETPAETAEVEYNIELAIPSVRRLAKENKINLSDIKGTGKGGRILKEDVLRYLDSGRKGKIPSTTAERSKDDRIVPLTPFQRAMVKTMTDSLQIPHFVYSDEIKVTNLTTLRNSIKDELEKIGTKVSYLPFFIKAASNALLRYPILNATLDESCQNVTYKTCHNIAIAMDTKAGLAVPVVKHVDELSIIDIARELNRLMASGKTGVFLPSDLIGGTFSISNIGAIGGTYMKPVILPPQVAIIAIGAIQRLPRFDDNGNVIAEEIVSISGAADHRIVDGATMANFINLLKKQIQNPNLLFLNL